MSNADDKSNATTNRSLRWLVIILPTTALLLSLVIVGFYVTTFYGPLSTDHGTWGQFGDYVGGILNPALAFLSLIAILVALTLQSKELAVSTEELRKSADAFVQQNFEATFFQLLRRVSEIVEQIRYKSRESTQDLTGLAAVRGLYDEQLKDKQLNRILKGVRSPENSIKAYEAFYKEWHHELGHYFRTLYHVFTFVDRSSLSEREKIAYANIARAQLSTYELSLLFYNGTTGEGAEGFKPLIEKYGILKHVNPAALLNPDDKTDERLYANREAFMSADERAAERKKKEEGEPRAAS